MCRTVLSLAGGVGGFSVTKRSPASAGSLWRGPLRGSGAASRGRVRGGRVVQSTGFSQLTAGACLESRTRKPAPKRSDQTPPFRAWRVGAPASGAARGFGRRPCHRGALRGGAAGRHRPLRRGVFVLVREIEAVPRSPHLPTRGSLSARVPRSPHLPDLGFRSSPPFVLSGHAASLTPY